MQSPAPASSLAEPPPAASPQLGRWICQQGLRSARIWGLLLVLAAASAAAAAASTTTILPCLLTFGHMSYWYDSSKRVLHVCVRRTWVLILPCVVFVVAPCNAPRACGLACFSGLGWMTIYPNNIYG